MNGRIKAAGFDLDGTLIDNRAMMRKTAEILISSMGVVGDTESVRENIVRNYFVQLTKNTKNDFCIEDKVYSFEKLGGFIFDTYVNNAVLKDGVSVFLQQLKDRGIILFIITNGSVEGQMPKIRSGRLDEIMDKCIISGEVGVEKPDPEIFRIAERSLGITNEEYVFFGDNENTDICGAKNAGVLSVNVKNNQKSQADFIIDGFDDVKKLNRIFIF